MILRPYQVGAVDRARSAFASGKRRILLCAPTGAGKTVIATEGLIRPAVAKGSRVMFLAHRQELIDQCAAKLDGLRVGIVKADVRPDPYAPVQVASVQTLVRRALPPADLVVVDEAHHTTGDNNYGTIIAGYPQAAVVGLSATPYRLDGRGLGECFDALIPVASVAELIAQGALVRPRTFALPSPDLKGVRTVAGDYSQAGLAARVDTPRLGTALVETYQRHAQGRSAIAFAVNVAHAQHIAEQFNAAGITAASVDGNTPAAERSDILARLASGALMLVANCGVLTEGFDCPRVSCVILARPTKSRSLWRQMVGRGLRPHDGKHDCQIHDHAGCRANHGDVTDDEDVSLAAGVKRAASTAIGTRTCPECYAVLPAGTPRCPECGYTFPLPAPEIPTGEHTVLEEAKPVERHSQAEKAAVLRSLITDAAMRGWKAGAVSHKYKALFGEWPMRAAEMERRVAAERERLACLAPGPGASLSDLDALYGAI